MRHATEAQLRRLQDEPLAIPDAVVEHVEHCDRCRRHQRVVADDAARCARVLQGLQPVPDVDAALARLRAHPDFDRVGSGTAGTVRHLGDRRGSARAAVTAKSAVVVGAAVVALGGTAAAATLTTVFAPTHVAPVSLSRTDVGSLASFMGLGHEHSSVSDHGTGTNLGGFASASGTRDVPFGTVQWTTPGSSHEVASLAQAEKETGLAVGLPAALPSGVSGPDRFEVQPSVQVTVTFGSATRLAGSSVVLDAGPGVLVTYGSASGKDVPTLGVLTLARPTATSTGATTAEIESFLLSQPDVPADLAQEIRLLGDLGTTLPVPVPPGAGERAVLIDGQQGVLVADASGAASGVVWQDRAGVVHAVAGLLDQQDVMHVADQIH